MTEKRFTLLEDTNGGLDTVLETMVKDNGEFLTHKECCDELNQLHEENIRLRRALQIELDKDLPSAPVGHCRCTTEPHRCDEND